MIGHARTCVNEQAEIRLLKDQGFSRVMTRPAGRIKGVSKSRGSGRVGSSRYKISRVGSGRVKRFSKSRGSGRVGSKCFKISRVGSGRVKRFSKSRGSGRVMTREIRVTSRVKP